MVGDPLTKIAQKQKKQVDFCNADFKSIVLNLVVKSPMEQRPYSVWRCM